MACLKALMGLGFIRQTCRHCTKLHCFPIAKKSLFDGYLFGFYGGSGVHPPPYMNIGCVLNQVEYHAYPGFCKKTYPPASKYHGYASQQLCRTATSH